MTSQYVQVLCADIVKLTFAPLEYYYIYYLLSRTGERGLQEAKEASSATSVRQGVVYLIT